MRRVVVTGIGLITPLGLNVKETWNNLIQGISGVGKITKYDASKFPVQIAAEVKGFDIEKYINSKEARKVGTFIHYAIAASQEALADAGLPGKFGIDHPVKSISPARVGINISAGMGGLPEIQYWDRELLSKEKKMVSPFFIPMIIPNMLSGQISILTNAQGPNNAIVSACATSSHSLGEAYRYIKDSYADIMITGGAEAVVCELGVTAFSSMKALSTRNHDPQKASRPYDKDRDGFVLGEGSGVLVLEEYEHAKKRGAKIYAEVLGYGLNADAYHMTTPSPEGIGAQACMKLCLESAKLNADKIDYLNSHGTSTPSGDGLEASAIAKVFESSKSKLNVSSTKSMTGHLLGAAGSVEAIFSILSIVNNLIPPTINLDNPDESIHATGLNFTPHKAVEKKVSYALSNSFGFGGTNASLIFGKV